MKTIAKKILVLATIIVASYLIVPQSAYAALQDALFKTLRLSATATQIDEFSTDGTMAGDSDTALPTEKAVKAYADSLAGAISTDSGTFQNGDLNGSANLVVTRAVAGDQYPSTVVIYDNSNLPIMADFTPTSTTITTIHLTGEREGGAIGGVWKYRIIYNF